MIRNVAIILIAAVTSLFAQQPGTAPSSTGVTHPMPVQQQPVAPDAPVITVHGICPAGKPTIGTKTDPCTLVLTRAQFEAMVGAINISNQTFNPVALRSLGSSYVTLMALADAGEKAGVEKDPRFQELMDVARTRVLAETYRRHLEEKYSNPSDAEIQAYYKQHPEMFEQTRIERIYIPKVNPLHSQDQPAEFQKKAREVAGQIRERAAKGEDMMSLQQEAYKTLGVRAMPPQTEMNPMQVRLLQKPVQADIAALKPGEVTTVELEPSGFNIYKVRTRKTISLEQAKPQIVREISQKNVDAGLKAATGGVHTDFNEQFFNDRGAGPPQIPGMPVHSGTHMIIPGRVHAIPAPASGSASKNTPQQ
ncbi:MAG TPA: peptidylprolyl isomerase [Candidatus Angelobacter sp.]|nr:peptidylprolyl isomerase [Candidatus Angelobacter sp.]